MFAGCIELGSTDTGAKLARLFQSERGLCGFPFDDRGIYQHRGVTLVQQRLWNSCYSKQERGVISHADSGIQLLGWLRIDNREELKSKLDFDQPDLALSDSGLVLTAYIKWGPDFAEHLIGDFAIVIWDPAQQTCILVRDQLGVRPLYYYRDKQRDLFVFATSVDMVKDLVGDRLEPSQQWAARYILSCSEDWQLSPYQQLYKVAPAHSLRFSSCFDDHELSQQPYFQFRAESDILLDSDQQYVERYRELLVEAIRCRSLTDFPLASELSGGLDSSTVAAIASDCLSQQACNHPTGSKPALHAFGFADREDERDCILSVAQFADIPEPLLMRYRDAAEWQIDQYYRQFLGCAGHPVEHPNAISHIPFYQHARDLGVRTMLSGFGGDEFVSAEAGQGLTEYWKSRKYGRWLSSFPGHGPASWIRALRWLFYRFRHSGRSPAAVNMAGHAERNLRDTPLKQELIKQFDLADRVRSFWKYDSDIETLNEFSLGNQWSPRLTARLENCTLMAAAYGIEYRWPLLDLRLLSFFLSVPVGQKLSSGKEAGSGRYLHRRACSGLLPDSILWKNKDMGAVLEDSRDPSPSDGAEPHVSYQNLAPRLQELIDRSRYQALLDLVGSAASSSDELERSERMLGTLKRLDQWLSAQP